MHEATPCIPEMVTMDAILDVETKPNLHANGSNSTLASRERQKSLMLRAWILSGLFFMALPGTLLGFSSLMAISTHHGLSSLPPAWLQGHGHAQMFGWIGSFILGIGFFSQPGQRRSVIRIPLTAFILWTSGVALRWMANIYAWDWRVLLPISAAMELIAVLLFLAAARQHKMPEAKPGETSKPRMELWMVSVLIGTGGLAAGMLFDFVECLVLSVRGSSLAFPPTVDSKYLVLLAWGFLVPTVWGFSARWLPALLAISKPNGRLFRFALLLDVAGVICGVSGWAKPATILLALGAITVGLALQLILKPHGAAKVEGIHPSF
ncbi:MAG: hypothetical protein M3Y72_25475, partial [Acidobacteriota bacterium]|nr:hypothetical protein [Acidobacteriota bacterium]